MFVYICKSNCADIRGIPDTASSPFDLCSPCHSRLRVLSAHWIPSPFGCWPLHPVTQSGVPCTLSRSVPALFLAFPRSCAQAPPCLRSSRSHSLIPKGLESSPSSCLWRSRWPLGYVLSSSLLFSRPWCSRFFSAQSFCVCWDPPFPTPFLYWNFYCIYRNGTHTNTMPPLGLPLISGQCHVLL